jgi:hypothetical protein
MEALKKEVADLDQSLNQLEAAEQRRLALEDQAKRRPDGDRRHRRLLVPDGTWDCRWLKMKNPACEAVRREAEEEWGR